jgi:hypothetical protein
VSIFFFSFCRLVVHNSPFTMSTRFRTHKIAIHNSPRRFYLQGVMIGAMPAVAVRHERRKGQEKRSKRPSQLYIGGHWLPPTSPSPTPSPNGPHDDPDRLPELYICGKVSTIRRPSLQPQHVCTGLGPPTSGRLDPLGRHRPYRRLGPVSPERRRRRSPLHLHRRRRSTSNSRLHPDGSAMFLHALSSRFQSRHGRRSPDLGRRQQHRCSRSEKRHASKYTAEMKQCIAFAKGLILVSWTLVVD